LPTFESKNGSAVGDAHPAHSDLGPSNRHFFPFRHIRPTHNRWPSAAPVQTSLPIRSIIKGGETVWFASRRFLLDVTKAMITRHAKPLIRRPRGFTLIEAAIVTVIVGVGIVGLLELMAAGSMVNATSTELTMGVFLASNIDEMMQGASYSTLHSTYDNKTFSPPKDARGVDLSGFPGWSQQIDVSYVDPDMLTSSVPDTQVEWTSRVTVKIVHDGRVVYTAQWLVAAPS
jgi:Tfp pilus assembly protein PilV